MMVNVQLHGKNGSRILRVRPRGFSTRHIRTRQIETQPEPPPPARTVPVCPVLKALRLLTDVYPDGDDYFILDEIFLTVRQECDISRDALLETLRSYYRDGQIAFRPGFGSQLQFALAKQEETP